ncbi:MAG: CocE/NonD family hydrolase [Reyranella sp.]|nr:CocE/NonD family hydrolase [Reyranella sp.]
MVPVTIDGESVRLALITYKPPGNGPFPTLIFHHGSTGRGNDPSIFARPYDPRTLAQWFTARGWAVMLPSRRGRDGSEGIYDEGFAINRSQGYACEETPSLPGADRALRDIDAVTPAILAQPFVDRGRVAVGGQSRGGILAIAWSGRQPMVPHAAINFVGGWMGAGYSSASAINQNLFNRGGAYGQPSIWLYGDKDPFYPLSHSRANFALFQAAGGKGAFHEYEPPPGLNGHQISSAPSLWTGVLEAYLAARGLPAKAP